MWPLGQRDILKFTVCKIALNKLYCLNHLNRYARIIDTFTGLINED